MSLAFPRIHHQHRLRCARRHQHRDQGRSPRGGGSCARAARQGRGPRRRAEAGGKWKVNQWLKKAVLLSFRLNDMNAISGGPGKASWWDKVPSKFDGWGENRFRDAGFRAVPGAIVRRSAFIAKNVVLMPSFVNLGAYVDESTMIDTWSTVGSCAQIGKRVHISGGVGIGGVLEPLQAEPVIVEDDCFIGARSEVAEGVIVRKGAVLAMGVFLGASTKIIDRDRRQDIYRRGAGICRGGAGRDARQAADGRPAGAVARLRGHRQDASMSGPAPRPASTNCCGTRSNRNPPARPICGSNHFPQSGIQPWTGTGFCSVSTAASTAPNTGSRRVIWFATIFSFMMIFLLVTAVILWATGNDFRSFRRRHCLWSLYLLGASPAGRSTSGSLLATAAKRLHDRDKSGWWLVPFFVAPGCWINSELARQSDRGVHLSALSASV